MEFFQTIEVLVGRIGAFAWGPPMLIFLVGTGFYLTVLLRGLQFRKLGYSLWLALVKRKEDTDEPGDISHFQALMTALSATVGTGNIAGVATATRLEGPAPCSGCGSPVWWAWRPNTARRSWRSNTASSMKTAP